MQSIKKQYSILIFSLIFSFLAFLIFFALITLNNFYIWDDFNWFLLGLQNRLENNSYINHFVLKLKTMTYRSPPIYDYLMFYSYQILGIQNPIYWYLLGAFSHLVNAFLFFQIIKSYFPQTSIIHLLSTLIFVCLSTLHENLFFIAASSHLFASNLILSSFLAYLLSFRYSLYPKSILLFFSAVGFGLAILIKQIAFLLPVYILLDLLFFRLPHIRKYPLSYFSFFILATSILLIYFLFKPKDYGELSMLSRFFSSLSFPKLYSDLLVAYHTFHSLFLPIYQSLPIPIKIFLSIGFFSLLGSSFLLSKKPLRKINLKLFAFCFSSIFASFYFFMIIFSGSKIIQYRYNYLPAFFLMIILFVILNSFFSYPNSKLKKILVSLSIVLIILNLSGLTIVNHILYQKIGKNYQYIVKNPQHLPSKPFSFLGFTFYHHFHSHHSNAIMKYLDRLKKTQVPSKYHFNLD